MMRVLRYGAYAVLLLAAAFITALLVLVRNQQRITAYALDRIYQRTGVRITIAASKIGLGSHLAVVLEQPQISYKGAALGTLASIRFVLSYPALLFHHGLPLAALELDQPHLLIPARAAELSTEGVPRLSPAMVEALRDNLAALADTAERLDAAGGALADEDGHELLGGLDLRMRRQHYRHPGDWPWLVDFRATLEQIPVRGAAIAGHFTLQPRSSTASEVAEGELWFWGLSWRDAHFATLRVGGNFDARITLAMDDTGVFSGGAHADARSLAFRFNQNAPAWTPPDLELSTRYRISQEQIDLEQVTLQQAASRIVDGAASLTHPFSLDRTLQITLGGARLKLARLYDLLRAIPQTGGAVTTYAKGLTGGELQFGSLALRSPLPLSQWSVAMLRDQLQATVAVTKASYQFPSEWRVPDLRNFSSQLAYSAGTLKVTQTSFDLGGSKLGDLSAVLNLREAPRRLPYSVQAGGRLDLGPLYPAFASVLRQNIGVAAEHVKQLAGGLVCTVSARDELQSLVWRTPRNYTANLRPQDLTATIAPMGRPIKLTQGAIMLTPGVVKALRLRIVSGSASGDATLDGTVELRAARTTFRHFTAELHRLPIEDWLPQFVATDDLAAHGLLGGLLTANGNAGANAMPAISGKLTLAAGDLSLGFLRSPIKLSAATLTLDGKGLILNVPGGWLEGEPLDLRMAVADLRRPAVRIDARAGKLDLLVMRFIRLPWSHPVPPRFFAVPVSGHLFAERAIFDRLAMAKVGADFDRDAKTWHVKHFNGQAYGGTISLEIDGRTGPDNWIRMAGTTAEMNSAELLTMAEAAVKPPLSGKLTVQFDLWGNTDTSFFDSLAGTFSLHAHDGVLNRFGLLSRILSLINLKNWITAQFPNPGVSGIPYKTINGDFKGVKGDFYTDNLRLDGPLMDISARGNIQFGESRLDMEVGMVPFSTVNWIVSHIPLVGANLAGGSRGLVGAYFHVYGPVNDPTIMPKPITSITEFVKRTLGLPVNIIAPHTIK